VTHRDRVGGALVHSELALALPAATADSGDASVVLERGGPGSGAVVDGPGVGQAWLERDGSHTRVRVETHGGASREAVLGFVQGIVLPAALQLGGAWHVHAGSVVVDARVVVLIGEPGAGKSLLAASLARLGHAFYGDDGLVIAMGVSPRAILGSPNLRLADEAALAVQVDAGDVGRCPSSGKQIVTPAVAGIAVDQRELPVRAFYALSRGPSSSQPRFASVKPSRAAVELLGAEFHPSPGTRSAVEERARFESAVSLARQVPMRSMVAPDDLERLPEIAAALVADLRSSLP